MNDLLDFLFSILLLLFAVYFFFSHEEWSRQVTRLHGYDERHRELLKGIAVLAGLLFPVIGLLSLTGRIDFQSE